MIKVNDLAFSGYPVTDMQRSRPFYEGALGLKPSLLKVGTPWIEYEIEPAILGIGANEKRKPSRDGASVDENAVMIHKRKPGHG